MTLSAPPTGHIPALDTLRAVAIIWVMLFHLLGAGYFPDSLPLYLRSFLAAGDAGVDLFFVLSGYLIARIVLAELARTGGLNLRRFWYRRWMRTLPAYYVTLGVILLGDSLYQAKGTWSPFWSYLVFLQTSVVGFEMMRFGWSWSLCVEELFYLFFPVFVRCLARSRLLSPLTAIRVIAGLACVVSIAGRAELAVDGFVGGHSPGYGIPYCRLDGLAVGLLVATLPPIRSPVRSAILGVLTVGLLGGSVWFSPPDWLVVQRFVPVSLLFGALVYSSISNSHLRDWAVRGSATVAAHSYALYLIHPIVISAVAVVPIFSCPLLKTTAFLVFSCAAARFLRLWVELRFLRMRDRSRGAPSHESDRP